MIPSLRVLVGDALEKLRGLPDESVHCCVTSPPYWGLRDYGTAEWQGGQPDCDHIQREPRQAKHATHNGSSPGFHGGNPDHSDKAPSKYLRDCGKCGDTRLTAQ